MRPDGTLARLLVGYLAVLEVGHLAALAGAGWHLLVSGDLGFPASPPPQGWTAQTRPFLIAIGALDAVAALVALAFVVGYFRLARWRWWVGSVALTAMAYSGLVYVIGMVATGAWTRSPVEYGLVVALFAPAVLLMAAMVVWAGRGLLYEPG